MLNKYGQSSIISFASSLLVLLGYLMTMMEEFDLDLGVFQGIASLLCLLFISVLPLVALAFGFYAIFWRKFKNIFSYVGFALGAMSLYLFLDAFI